MQVHYKPTHIRTPYLDRTVIPSPDFTPALSEHSPITSRAHGRARRLSQPWRRPRRRRGSRWPPRGRRRWRWRRRRQGRQAQEGEHSGPVQVPGQADQRQVQRRPRGDGDVERLRSVDEPGAGQRQGAHAGRAREPIVALVGPDRGARSASGPHFATGWQRADREPLQSRRGRMKPVEAENATVQLTITMDRGAHPRERRFVEKSMYWNGGAQSS